MPLNRFKVMQGVRRSLKIGNYTANQSALDDLEKVLELLPNTTPQPLPASGEDGRIFLLWGILLNNSLDIRIKGDGYYECHLFIERDYFVEIRAPRLITTQLPPEALEWLKKFRGNFV